MAEPTVALMRNVFLASLALAACHAAPRRPAQIIEQNAFLATEPKEGPPFDPRAARGALWQVNVADCKALGVPAGRGHSYVTFAPEGGVTKVTIDQPYDLPPAASKCVADHAQHGDPFREVTQAEDVVGPQRLALRIGRIRRAGVEVPSPGGSRRRGCGRLHRRGGTDPRDAAHRRIDARRNTKERRRSAAGHGDPGPHSACDVPARVARRATRSWGTADQKRSIRSPDRRRCRSSPRGAPTPCARGPGRRRRSSAGRRRGGPRARTRGARRS